MTSRSWPVLLLVLLLAACSGGDEPAAPGGSGSESAAGSAAPPDALVGSPAPAGYATQAVGELSFSVPGTWMPVEAPAASAPGVVQLALRAPAADGAAAPVALALLSPKPSRDARREVEALVAIKRDVQKAEDLQEQPISLEGFTSASLVSFTEQGPAGAQRTGVLIGDLPSGAVVTLTVIASPEAFRADSLEAIVLSARGRGRPA